ncbi:hypothetical protein NC652_004701 [Populus alba x Populus x berolinensis]|nr:hypothetical protein NC652_004701 [Populus alba x Populus x berolinensis]
MTTAGGVGVGVGAGRFMAYSPSPSAPHSPHISGLRSSAASSALVVEQEKYLSELLAERHKISPFLPVLPNTYRLLNQEILRVTTLLGNASVLGQSGLEHASPLASGGIFSNGAADANGWASRFQSEMSGILQPSSAQNWLSSQGSSSGLIVKRTIRVDIPVDKYPNPLDIHLLLQYNFVGRLLGPRGNSLKRVEATTECRVLIRGRGSIKDPAREDMMRGKPGYEHLNEPLHILVEGELPVEIVDARLMQAREILEDLLKPVDESQDYYKKQQLRELAFARKRALGACLLVLPVISGSDSTGSPVSANAPNRHRGTGTVCASSNLFLYEVCLSSVWVGGLMAVSHIKGPFGIKDC